MRLALCVTVALVSLVLPSAAAAARTSGDIAPGRYVVTLAAGADGADVNAVARKVARGGGRVVHRYRAALRGLAAASVTRAQVAALRRLPGVARVEPDRWYGLAETQAGAPWGLDRIDQRLRPVNTTYTYATTAAGVHGYVIDTGIRATHTEFDGRASADANFFDDGRTDDCNGHGTHVAGTVGGETYGVAKDVRLHAVRVIGCDGFGLLSSIVGGVDWVTANHIRPAVANMSLGGLHNPIINQAVIRSIASGVTYAVAAGNFNLPACWSSPASAGPAITVAATNPIDARAGFSNWGSCVDLFAPGVDIPSAWNGSDTDTFTASGTSMASPHAAGAAALYLATHPTASPTEVRTALVNASTKGVVRDSPLLGSPNRLLYTGF